MTRSWRRRAGFGLMIVLAVLGIVTVVLGSVTLQLVANRRALAQRERQRQTIWLARAGVEIASQKLLDSDAYAGGTVEIIPAVPIHIAVRREKDVFEVTSTAGGGPHDVVRELRRRFHREGRGATVRLVPADAHAEED